MTRARSIVRALGAVGLALAALGVFASAQPASAHDPVPPGLIPAGNWTDAQIDYMLNLIHDTETTLPTKFPTSGTYNEVFAKIGTGPGGMGYFDFGVPAPGGYWHFIQRAYLFDSHHLDPAFPESLVYQKQADGKLHLVAAMFMLNPQETAHGIPADLAWLPGWHTHPELCIKPDGGFGGVTNPNDPHCPPGTSQGVGFPMFHVWIVANQCPDRFGGVGVSGVMCEHDHGGGGGDHDHGGGGMTTTTMMDHDHGGGGMTTTTMDMDHGHGDMTTTTMDHGDMTPPPAQPIVAPPQQTG